MQHDITFWEAAEVIGLFALWFAFTWIGYRLLHDSKEEDLTKTKDHE